LGLKIWNWGYSRFQALLTKDYSSHRQAQRLASRLSPRSQNEGKAREGGLCLYSGRFQPAVLGFVCTPAYFNLPYRRIGI
jgi:hypothetical protein